MSERSLSHWPPQTIATLAKLKAVHRQLCDEFLGYPLGVHQRLARAMEMLTQDTQYTLTCTWHPQHDRYLYAVHKQERGKDAVTYYVDLTKERSCTCPDQETTRICKHALAVRLIVMCEEDYPWTVTLPARTSRTPSSGPRRN